jgi:hypothetical protein
MEAQQNITVPSTEQIVDMAGAVLHTTSKYRGGTVVAAQDVLAAHHSTNWKKLGQYGKDLWIRLAVDEFDMPEDATVDEMNEAIWKRACELTPEQPDEDEDKDGEDVDAEAEDLGRSVINDAVVVPAGCAADTLYAVVPQVDQGSQIMEAPQAGGQMSDALNQQAGRHLGDLVGWSLLGIRDGVDKDVVVGIARQLGLGDMLRFPKISPSDAYRRAVRAYICRGSVDERTGEAVKVEESNRVVHRLVTHSVVDDANGGDALSKKDVEFLRTIKIGFDKTTQEIVADDPDSKEAREIKRLWEQACTNYKANDIRSALMGAIGGACKGCPAMAHGGLWWVPVQHGATVRALAEWLRRVADKIVPNKNDWRPSMMIVPVFETAETIAALQQATQNDISGQLADLKSDLERFASSERTKVHSLESRVDDFDQLRERAELYGRLLGSTMNDLVAGIESARKAVVVAVGEQTAVREAARADAKAMRAEAKKAEREAAQKAKAQAGQTAKERIRELLLKN